MIINKDFYKKTGTRNHNFNFCKICKCYINDISYCIEKTIKKKAVFNNKILNNYEKAKLEYSIKRSLFDDIKKALEKKKNEINDYVQKINNLIKKLNEIALYSNIYENQENYCDYQIKIEKSEMKKGFEKRIKKIQDKKMRSYKLGKLFRNQNVFDNNLNEHLSILSNSMKSIDEDVYNTIQNVEN